jgi:2-polyprenyl-3-methyl-5-hydroxy-6-metoxy-1,4-benzoquinol methylase
MTGATRVVSRELLDELPQDSSAARASRRDLRIINHLLGSTGWFRQVLRNQHRTNERILELGAGTGELGRALNAIAPDVAGLDFARRPIDWPQKAHWFEIDVLNFARWEEYPIVIGNLFFHHFDHEGLARLGANLNAHARVIIASEPLRAPRAKRLFSLLCPLIHAHPVTRYDGRLSIGAGFLGDELPRLLLLDPTIWEWRVHETWLGASRLVAERRS